MRLVGCRAATPRTPKTQHGTQQESSEIISAGQKPLRSHLRPIAMRNSNLVERCVGTRNWGDESNASGYSAGGPCPGTDREWGALWWRPDSAAL